MVKVRSIAIPTRPLFAREGEKKLKYRDKDHTDISITHEKARRFISQKNFQNSKERSLFEVEEFTVTNQI